MRILWRFDNDLADFYSNFPGVAIGNSVYKPNGINGYGSCLYLNASLRQSVTIYEPPFLNMAYTSFSLVAWVKPNTFRTASNPNGDNAIFGQFEQNTKDRSLHIIVRRQKIYLGFYSDDAEGSITLYANNWYHVSNYGFFKSKSSILYFDF